VQVKINFIMMKHILSKILAVALVVFAVQSCCCSENSAKSGKVAVKTGIDVLQENGFAQLKGKRIGLVTNPTGVDKNLVSTVDILANAEGVELVALYGPEHGVRGNIHAGDHVDSSIDPATGLPVYSLYGATRKPTKEMLDSIDAIVYDIQDNGCRSFTYISTLGLLMEAAAEYDKEVIVLDRPNPLGGDKVEGCYVEQGYYSFVSQFKIPYLYGLTVGELAVLLNEEGLVIGEKGDKEPFKCKLTVVPMEGWSRDLLYTDLDLPWVLPSPHMPQAETVLYYPASGILGELGYMSIGVGYTLPFQIFAAPWIVAEDLVAKLDKMDIAGVEFRPLYVKPFYSAYKGENIGGVQMYVTDFDKVELTAIQFYVMQAMAELYPDKAVFDNANDGRYRMFDLVCGTNYVRETFAKTNTFDSIKEYWNKDVAAFKELSKKYYMYE